MQGQTILEVRNLKVHFPTRSRGLVKAVDGVSFSLLKGETLGIVGESGSGKTMTALAILGLQPRPGRIVEGEIQFLGDDLAKKKGRDLRKIRGRHISMILQDPNTSLDPCYSTGSQIAEAIKLYQGDRGESLWNKVVDALRMVRISNPELRAHDFPHQMSGGMRQRVAGAIGFCNHQTLLIADEPTTALDVTTQAQYLRLLKRLQQSTGMAFIFITHDMGLVKRMCDTVLIMYAGRVVERGRSEAILTGPAHPYTQALLNCVPRWERVDRLVQISGQPPDPADLPQGCRFAPRCPRAQDECWNTYPGESAVGAGHTVNCFFPVK